MKISVVIAAKNEEAYLPAALTSVSFSDDIVIVNDNSTDKTVAIAKANGARVFDRKLDGFASQKNFGIDKAVHDWVLILDADERLTPELIESIQNLKPVPGVVAYQFAWRNYLGDKWLAHGGLYPDCHVRLFNRRKARYGDREIHEELEIEGETKTLTGDVIHLTYRDTGAYYRKVVKYARLEAKWTPQRPSLKSAPKVFLVRYFKQHGYKDGIAGIISAALLGYYRIVVRQNMER